MNTFVGSSLTRYLLTARAEIQQTAKSLPYAWENTDFLLLAMTTPVFNNLYPSQPVCAQLFVTDMSSWMGHKHRLLTQMGIHLQKLLLAQEYLEKADCSPEGMKYV